MRDLLTNSFDDFFSMAELEDFEENDFEESAIGFDSEAPDQVEQIHEFLLRTPELTASEQAELLGAVVEDARRASGQGSGEVDWGRVTQGIQTGLSLFQTGAQIAGGIAGAFGGNNKTARDFARWSNRLGQGAGQIGGIFQAFRGGGQTPTPPRRVQRPAATGRRPPSPPAQRTTTPARRAIAPGGSPPANSNALLASLLNNPQIMQQLRAALFRRREEVPVVEVDIPNSGSVSIPLSEVMNTIARLAQESVVELEAITDEENTEIPDFLIAEDGEFIVDPERAEDREGLVLGLLRRQGEMERFGDSSDFVTFDDMRE